MSQYVAYDYDHQQFVEGEIARHLLIQQSEELLALLKSERGQEYVSFAYPANNLESLIEQTENDLLRLKRTAACAVQKAMVDELVRETGLTAEEIGL